MGKQVENERKAGPIFRLRGVHVRTMIEADGLRTVHPGDMRKAFPDGGPKATVDDPEIQKWLAWMRAGTKPQSRVIEVRRIPVHTAKLSLVSPEVCVGLMVPAGLAYCTLPAAMQAFGWSSDEAREFVECGALKLSAEKQPCAIDEYKIRSDDLAAFMQKTGCKFASDVRH